MPGDLLERIADHIRSTPVPTAETLELLDRAADEIERLRDELACQAKLVRQSALALGWQPPLTTP